MLRCVNAGLMAASLTLLCVAAVPAQAQSHRSFPSNALRGELSFVAPPEVLLNRQPARLAPGVRIRGEDNLLKLSGAVAGGRYLVHYTREATTGMLLEVWILNAAERANRLWPTNERDAGNWQFDPVGQTWSRP
jgi:hypothetical protein